MGKLLWVYKKVSASMNIVAGAVLVSMMLLVVADVILRTFGKPIIGTYELVSMAGAVVIGFALPQASLEKAHVTIDFLVQKRTHTVKRTILVLTRILSVVLFVLLGWYLILKADHLFRSGDVSMTLRIPTYYITYALSFICFVEAFILVVDGVLGIREGKKP